MIFEFDMASPPIYLYDYLYHVRTYSRHFKVRKVTWVKKYIEILTGF